MSNSHFCLLPCSVVPDPNSVFSKTVSYVLFTSVDSLLLLTIQSSTTSHMPSCLPQNVLSTAFSASCLFYNSTRPLPFQRSFRLRIVLLLWHVAIPFNRVRICNHAYAYAYVYACIFISTSTSSPLILHPSAS